MRTIREIPYTPGMKILVRVDFNVPLDQGVVRDDFRIKAAMPTIEYLLEKGAKVILMSHLESNDKSMLSLELVCRHLEKLGHEATFIADMKEAKRTIDESDGKLFILENLRFHEGERDNDEGFAGQLASLAEVYVNDAFSVSHRPHASIVGVPKIIPGYLGLQFENEIRQLSKAFNPAHPFLFILGGAKFATKMPLVDKFTSLADLIFIGGALANDFLKAQGHEVGKSLISDDPIDLSDIVSDPKVLSYIDVKVAEDGLKEASGISVGDTIVDAGTKTIEILKDKIMSARFILWNGPFGIYERGFTWGTEECARLIASNESATKIIGGGDTLAAISRLGIGDKFSFVSTGGGAMLDFLAMGTLPGLEAIGA